MPKGVYLVEIVCRTCGISCRRKRSRQGAYCSHECYWKAKVGKPGVTTGMRWNSSRKGKKSGPLSPEHRAAISKGRRGVASKRVYPRGESHPMWKGGVTTPERKERIRFRRTTQAKVFKRDDYTCQECQARGVFIQVDHIKPWSEYPELRFDMDNCRTLCMKCHYLRTFGKPIPDGIVWGHNLSKKTRVAQ